MRRAVGCPHLRWDDLPWLVCSWLLVHKGLKVSSHSDTYLPAATRVLRQHRSLARKGRSLPSPFRIPAFIAHPSPLSPIAFTPRRGELLRRRRRHFREERQRQHRIVSLSVPLSSLIVEHPAGNICVCTKSSERSRVRAPHGCASSRLQWPPSFGACIHAWSATWDACWATPGHAPSFAWRATPDATGAARC